jgi:AraC-like DNA-binding protein
MFASTRGVAGDGFDVRLVTCHDDHAGWSPVESRTGLRVVLVRRGRFRRLADGVPADLDPTVGYVGLPGVEERFAHPSGGDECTAIGVSSPLWRLLAGDRPVAPLLYVDARLDLAHRRLVRAVHGSDRAYALAEGLLALLAETLPIDRVAVDRRLVAAAREAVVADAPAARGLMPLAAELGVSPYRLSRAFSRELGVSLTRYRNRVRVGRALDRIEAGYTNGARLAAELGFADQAHLSRTLRDHVGHPPNAVRALLEVA